MRDDRGTEKGLRREQAEGGRGMNDTISRRAAIDALCKVGCGSGHCGISCDDVKVIEALPTAEKVGNWIEVKNRWDGLEIRCSECGAQVPRDGWGNAMQCNYCPNCGARMKGEGDDQ